jgi:flagellar hook-associated protein 3 FlgL
MTSWNRVATVPMHQTLFSAIGRSQQRLAEVQQQLATGKKAPDYAALGIDTIRNLSAHSMLTRQSAHAAVADRLDTTLSLMDAQMSGLEQSMLRFRNDMLQAVGTGRSTGLQEAAKEAFQHLRTALNADEGGVRLFAGSQTDREPFTPATLADTAGLSPADAFANDSVEASARVADGLDVTYGVTASEVGTDLLAAFRVLAEAGAIGDTPTAAQMSAIQTAIGHVNDGLAAVRAHNAENGRRQAQIETLGERAEQRSLVLNKLIARHEDADMAAVASELVQRQTTLEASYTVFSRLANLSLVNFLR